MEGDNMKKVKKILILSCISVISLPAYAFVFFAPLVEAKLDIAQGYRMIKDQIQDVKEVQYVQNGIEELRKLQTQIAHLQSLNTTAMDTFHKAESLVSFHGEWEDFLTVDILSKVQRTADRKDSTVKSILKNIDKMPEKIINNSEVLRKYVSYLDPLTLAQKDKPEGVEKLTPDMIAMDGFRQYTQYRDKLHGYTDEAGIEQIGLLEELNRELVIAAEDVVAANTDTQYKTAIDRVIQIEKQIDYEISKEASLRGQYLAKKACADQARSVDDEIDDLRQQKIAEADRLDKKVKYPASDTISDYFRKQEEEVI